MRFREITIERNFRISNDDQYAKERISATIELDDSDDEQFAMNIAREKIIENFKQAYPKVRDYLNFELSDNSIIENIYRLNANAPNLYNPIPINNTEKESTIETSYNYHFNTVEQIKKEMQSYKLGAKAFKAVYSEQVKDNPELQEIFNNKLKELTV